MSEIVQKISLNCEYARAFAPAIPVSVSGVVAAEVVSLRLVHQTPGLPHEPDAMPQEQSHRQKCERAPKL